MTGPKKQLRDDDIPGPRNKTGEDHELQFFQQIVDHSRDSFLCLNCRGQIIYANEQACLSLGYTREELLNLHLWDIDPDFSQKQWETAWSEKTLLKGGLLETAHKRKDGSVFPIEVSLHHQHLCGKEYIAMFGRDITARKQVESRLRESEKKLLDAQQMAHLGYWRWDVRSGDVEWSEETYKIFRLDRKTFKPNINSIMELSPWPEDHQRDQEILQKTMDTGEEGCFEQRFLRPDGSIGYYYSTFRGELNETGEIIFMTGTVQDITERKLAEQEKENLEAQLRQSQKMEAIGTLAGGIAHDFNNMLGIILGYVDTLRKKIRENSSLADDISEIEHAALRSRDTTHQLLAFSRQQDITPQVLDLKPHIDKLKQTLIRLIEENIDLSVHISPDLGKITFDPSQIDQILINLIINARDAMPDGGKITIEARNISFDETYCKNHLEAVPGDYIQLSISDTGCGMDPNTLSHAFDPFYTTKEVGKGTGLGLATVYGIVKQNHGLVEIYSEPKNGTSFKLYFPRCSGTKELATTPIEPIPSEQKTATILMVEDDATLRKLISNMLKELGHNVLTANTPDDAISLCKTADPPDLLLTDVIMPEMNGAELRDRILKIHPNLQVLFMSGYTDNVISRHGVLDENINFIQKPFRFKELSQKIQAVLQAG